MALSTPTDDAAAGVGAGASASQTAAHLLLQSPPGQTDAVLHDLRTILQHAAADADAADRAAPAEFERVGAEALRSYHERELLEVELNSGGKDGRGGAVVVKPRRAVVSSAAASVAALATPAARTTSQSSSDAATSVYADQGAGVLFHLDHRTKNVVKQERLAEPLPSVAGRLRAELDAGLGKYVSDHYVDGAHSVLVLDERYPELDEEGLAGAGADVAREVGAKHEERHGEEQRDAAAEKPSDDPKEVEDEEGGETKAAKDARDAGGQGRDEAEGDETDVKPSTSEAAVATSGQTARAAKPQKSVAPEPTKLVAHVVGHRYNLANYWSGRWRSTYEITLSPHGGAAGSPDAVEVTSATRTHAIHVHYFENGNVQLQTSLPATTLEPASSAAASSSSKGGGGGGANGGGSGAGGSRGAPESWPSLRPAEATVGVGGVGGAKPGDGVRELARSVCHAVSRAESEYASRVLAETRSMGEGAFKALRRTLPVTKQKMDWDKVMSYKLSTELGK